MWKFFLRCNSKDHSKSIPVKFKARAKKDIFVDSSLEMTFDI